MTCIDSFNYWVWVYRVAATWVNFEVKVWVASGVAS
jgi:hypothetical protein